MKKTLIALVSAGSFALGSTAIVDVTNVTSSNNSATFTSNTSKAFTIALTLDASQYATIADDVNLFKLTGKWEDDFTGVLGMNSIVGGDKNGLQGFWEYNTNTNKRGDINQYTCFKNLDWSTVKGLTMVMSYKEGSNNNTTNDLTDDLAMYFNSSVSIITLDGKITTVTNSNDGLYKFTIRKNNAVESITNAFIATEATVNATYVDSFTIYSEYMDTTKTAALSASRLVPEPTTATLSLLALAGLAARRRRK